MPIDRMANIWVWIILTHEHISIYACLGSRSLTCRRGFIEAQCDEWITEAMTHADMAHTQRLQKLTTELKMKLRNVPPPNLAEGD